MTDSIAGAPAIRRGTAADAAALAALAERTFAETFAADNTPENMAAYLAQSYGVPQQTAELLHPKIATLLIEQGGELVAYAQVRHTATPACVAGPAPVELWRFYVDRPWHGRGLAARLMDAVFQAARELGGRTVWLAVWERNPRAQAFYAKCGYSDVGSQDFVLGSDRQTDRIMARPL